jgi:predicted DNA-binding transcriptional regulator YafY
MRDENGLRRQWILLRALASRHLGLSIRQMADEVGVTQRTIRRDLDVFRSVGFPLEEVVGEFGRKTWTIKAGRDQPPLAFTYDEAIALHMGRRMLEPLAGTLFGEAGEEAFRKIRAVLGATTLDYLKQFSAIFHETAIGRRDYASKAEIIEDLQFAARECNEARLLYRSDSDAIASYRDVHPFGVALHRASLYLIALDAVQDRVKHYKVDRIEEVDVLARAFTRPEGFDLEAHMASAFGVYRNGEPIAVEVRFAPSVARYIREARWHESQELTPQPDGAVLATFTVSGTEEIKSWILSFGAKAEVLKSESLRLEIVEELRAMLANYSGPPDGSATRIAETVIDAHLG